MYNENTCRLCLNNVQDDSVLIFSERGLELQIKERINKFLSFTVEVTDSLPKSICISCLNQLEAFHSFYLKVLEVQQRLNSALSGTVKHEGTLNQDWISNKKEIDNLVTPSIRKPWTQDQVFEDNTTHISNSKDDFIDDCEEISTNNKTYTRTLRTRNPITNSIPTSKSLDKTSKRKIQTKGDVVCSVDETEINEFYKLECDVCLDRPSFSTFNILKQHLKTHHGLQGYIMCCRKKLFFLPQLKRHMKGHAQPDLYKCTICGTVCSTKWALGAHTDRMHVPPDQRPLQCSYCEQRFVRRAHLAQHEMSHYTLEQKKFICDQCGKAYPKQPNLDAHKKSTHSNVRAYICDICAKAFKSRHQLSNHAMTHDPDGVHRVQCHVCGTWKKNKYVLIVHMKTHNGPVPCSQCGKVFANQVSLTNHTRWVHSKTIKLHPCHLCDKKCKGPKLLQDHISTHTGDLPYQCPHCPKRFASSGNYSAHRRRCALESNNMM